MSRPREFVEPWRPEDIEERYRELEHMSHGEDEQNSSGECRDICPICTSKCTLYQYHLPGHSCSNNHNWD